VKVTAPIAAPDDQSAAFRLTERLRAALPKGTPARLDQDLVSIPDIAERTNRSREGESHRSSHDEGGEAEGFSLIVRRVALPGDRGPARKRSRLSAARPP
jgi:hypothetical protein